eukprot:Em0022g527a
MHPSLTFGIQRLEGKGIQRLEGKGIQRLEGKGSQRLEGKGSQRLEGKGSQRLEGKGSQRLEGKGIQRLEGKGIQRLEGKDIQRLGGKGSQRLEVTHKLIIFCCTQTQMFDYRNIGSGYDTMLRPASTCASFRSYLCKNFCSRVPIKDASNPGETVNVSGWVKSVRKQKELVFIELNDGSSARSLQVVVPADKFPGIKAVSQGWSLSVSGDIVRSPAESQPVELRPASVTVLGECDPRWIVSPAGQKPFLSMILPVPPVPKHSYLTGSPVLEFLWELNSIILLPTTRNPMAWFHRHIKAFLQARLTGLNWTMELPWVLLGIRTAPKDDLGCSLAELVYGAPLTVPGHRNWSLDTADGLPTKTILWSQLSLK